MPEKPVQHGKDHRPGGQDPIEAGPWHYVGQDGQPPFVNGSNAGPTGLIPNPVPMRFRIALGPPNLLSQDGLMIVTYAKHQIEVEGDITGISAGSTVFVLPLEYQQDYDVPAHSHDDSGNYVACRIMTTGEFVFGTP